MASNLTHKKTTYESKTLMSHRLNNRGRTLTPTEQFIFVGEAKNLGRFGAVLPGESILLTTDEAHYVFTGRNRDLVRASAAGLFTVPSNGGFTFA